MTSINSSPCCPICDEPAELMDEEIRSYSIGPNYRARHCAYCDLQYIDDQRAPDNIYNDIYLNSKDLPGYSRYSYFQSEVLRQGNPLEWLGRQEPAYWFIADELRHIPRTASIIEIGSGLGYLTFAIRRAGYDIVGMDISEQAVANARALFGDLYQHGNLFELADAPPRYDVVIMTEVIEHVSQPIAFLKAAAALLKPDGIILMTTPNKSIAELNACWETENPPVHLWWFSEAAIRQMARRSKLGVRLCDFTAMYTGKEQHKNKEKVVGAPAWLDALGNVTADARKWMERYNRRQPWLRRLRAFLPSFYRFADRMRRQWRYSSLLLQRSWQIGAVLKIRQ